MTFRIYSDFDGTISVVDMWDVLFGNHGTPEAFSVWQTFESGERVAHECIRIACGTVRDVTKEGLIEEFSRQEITQGFTEFVAFCKEHSLPLLIVTDGFDLYLDPFLSSHGCSHVEYVANNLTVKNDGTLTVEFPHAREGCRDCGNCKCSHILTRTADDELIVYIGDGHSDRCPVKLADIVFAKDTLASFCTREGIPFYSWKTFHDVRNEMKNILAKKNQRHRHQAMLRRRELSVVE